MRPVCSNCASLLHALGQWADEQPRPIVKGQATYLKNSVDLKKELVKIILPPNASIFMYNAVTSMYTLTLEQRNASPESRSTGCG